MRIVLAQTNPTIGDVDGNVAAMLACVARWSGRAELIVFPEQAVLGYPAKDLLLRSDLIERNVAALDRLAAGAAGPAVLAGFAEPRAPGAVGRPLYNSAALMHGGRRVALWRKRLLPNYDVFDEARYFEPASDPQPVIDFHGVRLGVAICEDLLHEPMCGRRQYRDEPAADLARLGAQLIIDLSASPYWLSKQTWRLERLADHARRLGVMILHVNQVGGNDELIFDGASCALDAGGRTVAQARSFDTDELLIDTADPGAARREPVPDGPAALHDALLLGVRDYVHKCGFRHVVMGLSGGVDSAVTAALATAALGPAQVHGVAMPSRYSSPHSLEDAQQLAVNLGIRLSTIPIESLHAAGEALLAPHFEGRPPDAAEENIQARLRGMILMALSNKLGGLLLTTGNKSELAVGYCTLYGDMCGGLAVISDVPKTMVYALAESINRQAAGPLIPLRTIQKPPSAELRPDQTDQDTLPPYEQLDEILARYEVELQSPDELSAAGFERDLVTRVVRMLHQSEYKRQQAAPGIKVTSRAFGFGRRMPIAARWTT
jgi:NAD+ synthase (glutamine-hydrolysing)